MSGLDPEDLDRLNRIIQQIAEIELRVNNRLRNVAQMNIILEQDSDQLKAIRHTIRDIVAKHSGLPKQVNDGIADAG